MEQYYTPLEAARLLKVDRNTIYRWIRAGKMEAKKFSGAVRIPAYEIPTYARKESK